MKTKIIISLFTILSISQTFFAQVEENFNYQGFSFTSFRMPLTQDEIGKLNIISNAGNQDVTDFIDEYSTNFTTNFFSCNAGIENTKHEPLGLFITQGQEVQAINLSDGNGNFFLKPNGIVYANDSTIDIVDSRDFQQSPDIKWAIQSGPLLLNSGNIHPEFNPNSTNLNQRIGVGVSNANGNNDVIFVISNEKVNFHTFASMFKEQLNCNYALCLESGRPFAHFPSQNRVTSVDAVISNLFMYSDKNATNSSNSGQSKYIVPMLKTPSGIYEIPIIINNTVRLSFVFDSGASDVTITPDVAMVLFKSGTIEQSDYIDTQTYVFADGSTADCTRFNIKEINIGGMILKNVTGSISSSISAPMLLGQSVMQRLGKYSIDNATHCLIIE
jgi:uncharacterized protein YigE (DUF2233 family)